MTSRPHGNPNFCGWETSNQVCLALSTQIKPSSIFVIKNFAVCVNILKFCHNINQRVVTAYAPVEPWKMHFDCLIVPMIDIFTHFCSAFKLAQLQHLGLFDPLQIHTDGSSGLLVGDVDIVLKCTYSDIQAKPVLRFLCGLQSCNLL